MIITIRYSVYSIFVLFSLLCSPIFSKANELEKIPPPASGHSTTDALLLRPSSMEIITSAPPVETGKKNIPHSDAETTKTTDTSLSNSDKVLSPSSKKAIDTIVNSPARNANEEDNINPYQLEKNYGINSKGEYTTKPVVKTQRTVVAQKEPPKNPQKVQTVRTVTERDYEPKVDEEGSWQASGYRFSPELNKIRYPSDSPLKMITMQIMVEASNVGIANKARRLLEKINNALPQAVLIAGLHELYVKESTYPLAQWNRDGFRKAIKKVSSHQQDSTIGYGLQQIRPSLLNLPYPLTMLLITDGEHYNIDNLAFDTKIFYAPDPRSPLNIVSFAKTKSEKDSIRIIQKVHKGTYVFDGDKLLQDESAFTAFMKALFVK